MHIGSPFDRRKSDASTPQLFGQVSGSLLRCFADQVKVAARIRSDLLADAFIHPSDPFVREAVQTHGNIL